ncbi:hypothetical protein [Geomicrobium sp. JCM 19055]|uniref:hypothetical protein n=1 Tax=Geomicrobium sp. JCM 19055 TaxID=1460649 RepID=UPI00045ED7B7|nr:hypothetical protein [Geomicrobium sp. JCM 19055]GAJ98440.1 hypothetical protein JCM19055_1367 [Geomicrobium sp. JCM 19055]
MHKSFEEGGIQLFESIHRAIHNKIILERSLQSKRVVIVPLKFLGRNTLVLMTSR